MMERRRVRRRNLPFVRSGVLEVNGRAHIVAVMDLSPESAFLQTRISVRTTDSLVLRMVLPRDGHQVALGCEYVRRLDPKKGRTPGIVVRFKALSPAAVRRIEEFASEGVLPHPTPPPSEHFEYKTLDGEVQLDELNRLGLDGWRLAAVIPAEKGPRYVFLRSL